METKTNPVAFGGAKLLGVKNQPPKGRNALGVSGVELMRRINDGVSVPAPPAEIQAVRTEISRNCEELLEQGARIRPLIADKKQIGWIRGLHLSERKVLARWIFDPNDFIAAVLKTCTSLNKDQIEDLSAYELRRLAELIAKMSDYDLSLYPFLSAYATTSSSENLWFSEGQKLTSYEDKIVRFPQGGEMTILRPPDHAKLWATLCNYREQAKERLDHNFNALLIVQPWAGKSADALRSDLRAEQRNMAVDAIEPWERIIRVQKVVDKEDGWAHSMDDSSVEGLQRELKGMFEVDKHERFMKKFYDQQQERLDAEKQRLETLLAKRGGPGVRSTVGTPISEAESRRRERELKKGRAVVKPVPREQVTEPATKRIQKYR